MTIKIIKKKKGINLKRVLDCFKTHQSKTIKELRLN